MQLFTHHRAPLLSLLSAIGFITFAVAAQAVDATTAAPAAGGEQVSQVFPPSGSEGWTINYTDVDLPVFIQNIAEMTGDTYIIPSNMTGKVNVISQEPLNRKQVQELFLKVLRTYGYTAMPGKDAVMIQQVTDSKRTTTAVKKGKVEGESFVIRVFPVKYTQPQELQSSLQPFISEYGQITALVEARALLVADRADNVNKVQAMLSLLDMSESQTVETVQLQSGSVGSVLPLLEKLAPRELTASKSPGYAGLRIVADERSNTVYLRGSAEDRTRIRELIKSLDQPTSESGTAQVISLQYANAQKVEELLKDFVTQTRTQQQQQGADLVSAVNQETAVYIKADPTTNTLIVRAPSGVMSDLRRIIQQLDVRRMQVLIEAAIIEITDDMREELGIQFGAGDSAFKAGLAAASFANSGVGLASIVSQLSLDNSGVLSEGFTASVGSRDNFTALIKALSSNSRVNLLSTPSITTVDNQEAKILVGQNVPFRTGTYTTNASGSSNPFTTIERKDIGITLKVTPQINAGNQISLKVDQEVSSIQDDTVSEAADIITNKRTISTTVLADNNETVVLGGLIQDDKTTSKGKVPVLGDIPVVGMLFQSNRDLATKRNLLVFLRPTVLANQQDVEQATYNKFNGIWDLRIGKPGTPLEPTNLTGELNKIYDPNLDAAAFPPSDLPWVRDTREESAVVPAAPVPPVAPLPDPALPPAAAAPTAPVLPIESQELSAPPPPPLADQTAQAQ